MNNIDYKVIDRGLGGYCEQYNIDSLEVRNVVVAVRFTHWSDKSRKPYYEIPVSEKNQNAVIAAFPELDLQEDEPGAILLFGCDDETAVKVGMFAAELDGDLTPEPETPNNNDNTMKANKTYQVQQHGRKTEYKTKKAALKLADELAIYNESDNVSVYEYNHNTGIYTEIYTREYNTDNTPATMNEAKELSNAVEFSELSHAGQCTDIYLHNTAEIYKRYTIEAVRYAAGLAAFGWDYVTETLMHGAKVKGVEVVNEAVKAAVLLVKKYDHLTPTAKDVEQVTRNYAAYIVESAKYEVENA